MRTVIPVVDRLSIPSALTQTALRASEQPGKRAASSLAKKITARARTQVPADSVALFRVGYGAIVVYSSIRFLVKGWVDALYLEPQNHLTYRWFGWVQPLPEPLMHIHIAVLAVLGVCIAVGFKYRLAVGTFLVGFTYTELIDAALYLNHYWFISLTGLLLLLLPVHHHWSVDAAIGRVSAYSHIAAGVVWALRTQIAVVYCFAGLSKLNPDWLLRAQPLKLWLADRTHIPVVGSLLDEPVIAYLASWLGAGFDCLIVAFLLWRRTRPYAYIVLAAFHLATGALFQIGVFPWVMIVSSLVFFNPDWPLRLTSRLVSDRIRNTSTKLNWLKGLSISSRADQFATSPKISRFTLAALVGLALIQLALPIRHYAIAGNVRWTEEGYYFAWRVMLTEKAGHVEFQVTDPSNGETWSVDPGLVLTEWQTNHATTRPDLIHATAHLVADHYHHQGRADVEVRAHAWVSMNGHPVHRLVDPRVNLVAYGRGHLPAGWILEEP